jgi:hypothetical protein
MVTSVSSIGLTLVGFGLGFSSDFNKLLLELNLGEGGSQSVLLGEVVFTEVEGLLLEGDQANGRVLPGFPVGRVDGDGVVESAVVTLAALHDFS